MNLPSREALAHLREKYPVGSRIKLGEMKDPYAPVEPGSMGTLKYIDDIGTFHVHWDNGRGLGLVPGEDSFSVLPLESTLMKLYMPLTARLYEKDGDGHFGQEPTGKLDSHGLLAYEDAIRGRLEQCRAPEDAERGLMHHYHKDDAVNAKVHSALFTVEERDRQLWGVAVCHVEGSLSLQEKESLIDYISGQASDGWGEGFEQQEIKIGDCKLNVSFCDGDDWSIQTEQERFGSKEELPDMCWTVLPSEGILVCIVRGEKGYSPCDWNTSDPAKNRRIADYNNQKRGITKAQEQAMVGGSMCGWDSAAADPAQYEEQQGSQMGGMGLA